MQSSARDDSHAVAMQSAGADVRPVAAIPSAWTGLYPASPPISRPPTGPATSLRPSRRVILPAATVALAGALIVATRWVAHTPVSVENLVATGAARSAAVSSGSVVIELTAAALIGLLVTSVQREVQRDRALSRSMEQAQVLLCLSGALMMIIIGDSLARAFGIAGAAAIIRFRTPVEDPRDTTILFLLLALGMAAGIGALTVAGLGTLGLCALLPALEWFTGVTPRTASVECTAAGPEFPVQKVRSVFSQFGIRADARELVTGDAARMKYVVSLAPSHHLEDLTAALVRDAGLAGVAWDVRKKS